MLVVGAANSHTLFPIGLSQKGWAAQFMQLVSQNAWKPKSELVYLWAIFLLGGISWNQSFKTKQKNWHLVSSDGFSVYIPDPDHIV
jgi:hypothetical protein